MNDISILDMQRIAAGKRIKEKKYWLNALAGDITKTGFPYDYQVLNSNERVFETITCTLAQENFLLLSNLSGGSDIRLHIILAAGLVALLHKYTGSTDIILGMPIYKQDVEGEYINKALALRNRFYETATYRELLNIVRTTISEAIEHQDYPIEILAEELNPSGVDGDFPLFGCAIMLENIHDKSYIQNIPLDMIFSFVRDSGHIGLTLAYNPLRYKKESVQLITVYLERLFLVALANLARPLPELEILTKEEKENLVFEFNNTAVEFPATRTIAELFAEQVNLHSNRPAVSSNLDLSSFFADFEPGKINLPLRQKFENCCFKKNPYIFKFIGSAFLEAVGIFTGTENKELTVLRTHKLNYIAVNKAVLALMDCFDGKANVRSIFREIAKSDDLQFLLYTIRKEKEETGFTTGNIERMVIGKNFDQMILFVNMLLCAHLIDLAGYNPVDMEIKMPPPMEGREEAQARNVENENPNGYRSGGTIKSPVLLLGDRTGPASTGLLYIASFLRRNGIAAYCQWNDIQLDIQSLKANIKKLLKQVRPKIVGVSMKWFPHIARVLEICQSVKEFDPTITIAVGGNTASYYKEKVIRFDCIDYVIVGDGEEPFLKLCLGENPVPNCVYKEGDTIIETPQSYVQNESNSSDIYFSHLDQVFVSSQDPYLASDFFICTGKGCSMQCFYCGGCRTAQEKTFKRQKPFMRGAEEVRKDIIAASPYTSTFFFDFDLPAYQSLEYYKTIWDGLNISQHFCEFYFWQLPSFEFLDYVVKTFTYIYINIDLCSLSEPHRLKLSSLGIVKPQPTDEELFLFFKRCRQYDNIEIIVNQITGLPHFTREDITHSHQALTKILSRYANVSAMDWGRLHAQPGAPIVDSYKQFNMRCYATTFEDFLHYSQLNMKEDIYPVLLTFNYPYIYSEDDDLNSKISKYYLDSTRQIAKYKEENEKNLSVVFDLSYSQLAERSDRLARLLRSKGVGDGVVVGVMVKRSMEMIVTMLAIIKAGGAYLPIDYNYPAQRIKYMLSDSKAALLLVDEVFTGECAEISFAGEVIDINNEFSYPFSDTSLPVENNDRCKSVLSSKSLAYIIYTSGSTGKPKGVMVEHCNVARLVKQCNYMNLDPGKRLLLTGNYVFDIATFEIWGSLLNGLNLFLADQEVILDGEKLKKFLWKNEINILHLVPQVFNLLASAPGGYEIFSGLEYFLVGGDLVSPGYINELRMHNDQLKILHMYGPTENTTFSTFFPVEKEYKKTIPLGKPIVNSTVYILNKNNHVQPIGIPGEICVGGAGITRGYLNNPELTVEKFSTFLKESDTVPLAAKNRLYRTGDLGKWNREGNIEFLGREDHQVKIRGFRIELGEIETQLLKHESVKEALVLHKEKGRGASGDGNQDIFLCAYIVLRDAGTPARRTLRPVLKEYLAQTLPDYMIPDFVFLDQFPLTHNGKLDKRALPDPELIPREEYIAPRDIIEEKLVAIWSDVLDRTSPGSVKIGIEDNFFDLGGHSLKATILASKIHKIFDVKIQLVDIFKMPQIKELANYIKKKSKDVFISIEPAEEKEYYVLSSAQKRLYVLQYMNPEIISYNIPEIIPLPVDSDLERIEDTFIKLIKQHESLRTSFHMINDVPAQVVHDHVEFKADLRDINNSQDLQDYITQFVRPFDLAQAPLIRAGLLKETGKQCTLIVDMHHIISDGSSNQVLINDFLALYQGKNLLPLPIQYKDFSEWQNREKETENFKRQEKFWLQEFVEEVPVLELPIDFPRPVEQSFEGNRIDFEISSEETRSLNEAALRENTTLFILLDAVFNILLSKLSNQEDIVIGTPIAGRRHADLDNIIGMFVNTLALRNYLPGDVTFCEFLAHAAGKMLMVFENQEYPFEDLVEKLSVRRDLGRNPLFDAMFGLQNMENSQFVQANYRDEYETIFQAVKFDLELYAVEKGQRLFFSLHYCTKLFKKETVERFIGYFKKIISSAVNYPGLKIGRIEIISEEEKKQILYKFNDMETEYPQDKTIHRLFEEQAEKTPDHMAVIGFYQLTYRELHEQSGRLAFKLIKKGVVPDTVVGIKVERSVEMVVGIFGILKATGAYLPIDPGYPQERIDYMLKDSGAKILLDAKEIISLSAEGFFNFHHSSFIAHHSNHLAYVIYTSGTTGKPKGVTIEHHSLVNRLNWMQKKYPILKNDTILQKTTFTFDVSAWEIFWWSIAGAKVCLLIPGGEKDPEIITQTIEREGITTMHFVPSMLSIFLDYVKSKGYAARLSSLKQVIASGEALLPAHVKTFEEILCNRNHTILANLYGPTEASIDVSYFDCLGIKENDVIPIGKPIDNIRLYILDKHLQVQPINIPGELHITGVGLSRGYLNRPELTAEKFQFNRSNGFYKTFILYKTGDLARWLPDGNIEFLGRIDHQVKIRGFRIELEEIESRLSKIAGIKETVVVVRQGDGEDKYICAYFVPDKEYGIHELRENLAKDLPTYMIPSFFIQMKSLPLTANGKIDRKALPKPDGISLTDNIAHILPATPVEKKLVEIWEKVLGRKNIGITENFFLIGGDSIKSIQIISRMGSAGYKIVMKDLFQYPLIKDLAPRVKELKRIPDQVVITGENIDRTLSDFTFKGLTLENIDRLRKEYPGIDDIYTLTPMQEGMLFYSLVDEASVSFFEQTSYRLLGDLDISLVEKSLNQLIQRHDILRTAFVYMDIERPVQVVLQERKFDFYYEDISEIDDTGENKEVFVRDFKNKDKTRPFNLSKGDLMRVSIIKIANSMYELTWSFHHILMDGWCIGILNNEFLEIYSSFIQGRPHRLPGVKPYKTFIRWLDKQDKEEPARYWESYLESFDEQTGVPTSRATKAKDGNEYQNEVVSIVLDIDKTAALKKLAGVNQVTLNILIQTLWGILLGKYNQKEDVIFGAVVSGRPSELEGIESMIGLFINTIPVRIRCEEDMKLKRLLALAQEKALNGEPYHYYPLVEIQSKSSLKQNLIDHIMVFENYPINEQIEGFGKEKNQGDNIPLRLANVEIFEQTNYDFNIVLGGTQQLLLKFLYNGNVYDRDFVERITAHFRLLTDQVIENPELKIGELKLLSEEEKKQLLSKCNGIEADFPGDKTIHRLFEEQVEKKPDHIALVGMGQNTRGRLKNVQLTYEELNRESNRLAHRLRENGVGPNRGVGLMMDRSIEMIVGILAVLKAGGGYLPIDAEYPEQRVLLMLADSNISILLTQEKLLKHFSITSLKDMKTHRQDEDLVLTPPQIQVKDFDKLPKPDRTLINYKKYHQSIGIAMAKHTVSIQATRGCPFNCAFCHKIWPKTHVERSAENILEEIRCCYDAGVKRFVFIDDIFNLDKRNSGKVFENIIKDNLDIQLFFPNGLRGDILDKDFIDLMVEAGTVNIDLALESASRRIQQLIHKNLNLDKFAENIRYIIEKYPQVLLEMELMIGFPSETEKEALLTFEFLKNLKWVHFPNLNILKIYPNTEMYKLARKNGIGEKLIERSVNLAYHELPETLPFSKVFVKEYQTRFMNEYLLSKERLLHVLPYQIKTLTGDELVQKYNSYLPMDIKSFSDIIDCAGITGEELGNIELLPQDHMAAPDFGAKAMKHFPAKEIAYNPFKILLLDLSLFFSEQANSSHMLYDMIEEPLGLMYLLTHLNEQFNGSVWGKIAKSRIDFDSFEELKNLLREFKPHLIGIRTLSYYKEFFHRAVLMMRHWGIDVPIVAGGPYATSDYRLILQDTNVDLVVMGEGELTLAQLVKKMIENNYRLPGEDILSEIRGIAFVKNRTGGLKGRDIRLLDHIMGNLNQYPAANPGNINQPDDLLYLIYTSGSTGKPKGVMVEHRNLVNLIHYQYHYTNIDCSRILQFSTISFDASFHEIFSVFLSGGQLFLVNKETRTDIPELFKLIERNGIKTVFLPISFLKMIFKEEEYINLVPWSISHIQTAGEQVIINDNFRKYLKERKIYLHNHYGPSETHVVTTLTIDPEGEITGLPSIGKPVMNTGIYIVDKSEQLLPLGVAGELWIGGVQVGRGYLNRPELTAEKFIKNRYYRSHEHYIFYKTGDLARWLTDGNIEFLGRIDQQIKIRGFRVELGEIENWLLKFPGIKETVVSAQEEKADKYLCAYIVSDREYGISELREHLSNELPDYMIPSYFVRLEKIPLTPSGKVDRRALPVHDLKAGEKYHAPRNEIETKLVELWAQILGRDELHTAQLQTAIGIDDNFFELGGHSLKATMLVSRIHKVFDVKVPLAKIFEMVKIRELANYIKEKNKEIFISIEPAEEKEYYLLSSGQKRLYVLYRMNPESISYNIPEIIPLTVETDLKKIEETFRKLIARHESLRTSFYMINNNPVQVVHDHVEFKPDLLDLNDAQASQDYIKRFIRPFDLTQAPLLRAGLITGAGKRCILIVDMHHIISDGVSHEVLLNDFLSLYEGKALSSLRIQYRDFSEWQNKEKEKENFKCQEKFWLMEFAGKIPVLELPVDFPRPVEQSFEGNSFTFEISPGETRALNAVAVTRGTTLFMALVALFNVLLYKLSNQEDIVIGTPIAGRRHADLEKIIGMFVNTLVLRNYPDGSKTFSLFLAEIKERTLQAFENQEYPFEELVEKIMIRRDPARNPLFDVMFSLEQTGERKSQGTNRTQSDEDKEKMTRPPAPTTGHLPTPSKFDLTLTCLEKGDQVFLFFEYCTALFKKETIERWAAYLKQILGAVTQNPGQTIFAIEMLTEQEKHRLLFDFNDTAARYPKDKTLHELFAEQVERTPDHVAVIGPCIETIEPLRAASLQLTYRELTEQSNLLAFALLQKGVVPDTIVGIKIGRSIEMIAGILGILKSGGAYLPIDPDYPQERIDYMLKDSGAKLLITTRLVTKNKEGEKNLEIIFIDSLSSSPFLTSDLPRLLTSHPFSLAYLIYTSGSTGKPKGVLVNHLSVINMAMSQKKLFRIDEQDRVLQFSPICFDMSVEQIFITFLSGAALVLIDKNTLLDIDKFEEFINHLSITHIDAVPSFLNNIRWKDGCSLKRLVPGGEDCPPELAREWSTYVDFYNSYGPTEVTVTSIITLIKDINHASYRLPIGKPINNTFVYILDKGMNLVPTGILGEMFIGGEGLCRGYLNLPEVTAEKFIYLLSLPTHGTPIYKTGDLARWLEDGNIEFLGRVDNQVKIRGYRIELEEIEGRLLMHDLINEAIVIPKTDEEGNTYICAYIVSNKDIQALEIRDYLSNYLPDYMIPSYFVNIEKVPVTLNGKINYQALTALRETDTKGGTNYMPPHTPIQKKLIEIWEKVLGRNNIGIKDNFYEAGGDSIKAIQMISRINGIGYKIEMKDFFKYPTISELALRVKKVKRIAVQSLITGNIPLTPIQSMFFCQYHFENHFNQAVMLHSKEKLYKEAIIQVFTKIQEHHDALRMTYYRSTQTGEAVQINHGLDYPLAIEEYNLENMETAAKELGTKVNQIQSSIDMENGPLMKLGLFHLADGDLLLIAIHHLVIDGVSWRILFEDIETLYNQYKRGERLSLPPKTDSFKIWAEGLAAYANSKTFLKEKSYWQKIESAQIPLIPKDIDLEDNYEKDTRSVSFTLAEEETGLLLEKVNKAFKTEINDILLTALGIGINKTFGHERMLIALEGHGREEILKDMDINRTVGWFTTVYPVLFNIPDDPDLGRIIKENKETLRQIPNKGIGYGILKYLTHKENKKEIEFELNPQISFNYLGQFDADVKKMSLFEIAKESSGNVQNPNIKRDCLLDILGITARNRFTMSISYNKMHFYTETMNRLIANFETGLKNLISFCCSREQTEYTPSDFTYTGLTIDGVDRLLKIYPNTEDIYTLTPMQEGMLFHAMADRSSHSYFEQIFYRLQGELNIKVVEESLNELLKRHDILRTVFIYEDIDRPVQLVLKERAIDFYYEDINNISGLEEKENYIKDFKAKDKQRSFDLSKDVLMRVAILRTDHSEYEFIWDSHHILMDGWCLGILNNEFLEIYSSYIANRPHRLPGVKPYKTFIQWLDRQDKEEPARYWENYLDSFDEQAGIPRATTAKDDNIYRNEIIPLALDLDQTAALKKLAVGNQVTLNTLIQVVWGILLGKYNEKEDVVFGAVVSGRPSELEGVESMVGLFINTIPVRIKFESGMKFNRLLPLIQEEALNSELYHYYSLAQIQSRSALKQNLIDHIFIFENYPIIEQIEGYGKEKEKDKDKDKDINVALRLANIEVFEQTNYDFNVILSGSEQLLLRFHYNGNVYERYLIERIAAHFSFLVGQVITNPELEIKNLTLLSEEEKNRILYEFNDTKAAYPWDKTMHRLFEEQVEKTPDNIAVIGTSKLIVHPTPLQITYKELNEKSAQLAGVLQSKGVSFNMIIGLMMRRNVEMVVGILGILKSGCAYMPIDTNYPEDRINYMLRDIEVKLLVDASTFRELKTGYYSQAQAVRQESMPKQSPTSLAYVIFTSGTTGKPKAVVLEHSGVVNTLLFRKEKYALTPGFTTLQLFSFSFDGFVTGFFTPIISGAKVILASEDEIADINRLSRIILNHRVNQFISVPALYHALVTNAPPETLTSLKTVTLAGDVISPGILEHAASKHIEIAVEYGVTEASVMSTFCRDLGSRQKITIGKPVYNTQIYILGRWKQLQVIGVPGELCISGVGVARGYLNRPELTAEKFNNDLWGSQDNQDEKNKSFAGVQGGLFQKPPLVAYKTGDLARWLPDGNIEFLGRIDYQVKIRGFRIELGEIETQLKKHREIKEAIVIAEAYENGNKYLCAYISTNRDFQVSELRRYLADRLPEYMIPSKFVLLEEFPLTANGKINRKNLNSLGKKLSTGDEYVAPKSDNQIAIAEAWKKILEINQVGIYDNFFDLGGTSLDMIRLNSKLKEIFKRDIPIVDMYRYTTIDSFSHYLDGENMGVESSPISLRSKERADKIKKGIEEKNKRRELISEIRTRRKK